MSPDQARVRARGFPLGARLLPSSVAPPAPTTEAPDTKGTAAFAELWTNQVMEHLADAKEDLAKPPPADARSLDYRKFAHVEIFGALKFVVQAFKATPRDHPNWIKLRIMGRSLDGILGVLGDRLKLKGGDTPLDDLRLAG